MVAVFGLKDCLLKDLGSILFGQSCSEEFRVIGSFGTSWSGRTADNKLPFFTPQYSHVYLSVYDPFDHGRNGG